MVIVKFANSFLNETYIPQKSKIKYTDQCIIYQDKMHMKQEKSAKSKTTQVALHKHVLGSVRV